MSNLEKFLADGEALENGPANVFDYNARTLVSKKREIIRVLVEALRDPENHWHTPDDLPDVGGRCTACEALAEAERIASGKEEME